MPGQQPGQLGALAQAQIFPQMVRLHRAARDQGGEPAADVAVAGAMREQQIAHHRDFFVLDRVAERRRCQRQSCGNQVAGQMHADRRVDNPQRSASVPGSLSATARIDASTWRSNARSSAMSACSRILPGQRAIDRAADERLVRRRAPAAPRLPGRSHSAERRRRSLSRVSLQSQVAGLDVGLASLRADPDAGRAADAIAGRVQHHHLADEFLVIIVARPSSRRPVRPPR